MIEIPYETIYGKPCTQTQMNVQKFFWRDAMCAFKFGALAHFDLIKSHHPKKEEAEEYMDRNISIIFPLLSGRKLNRFVSSLEWDSLMCACFVVHRNAG